MADTQAGERPQRAADETEPQTAPAPLAEAGDVTLSVLVVAYNSAKLIEACIASVPIACTRQSFEVLLIDNGDGSTETLVRERFPQVRIVPSRGNIGFAAGNNALASSARGKFILLLNPDMKLHPGAIDALFDGVEAHPDASAWGGVTVDAQGIPDTGNAIPKPSLNEFAQAALGRSGAANLPPERLEHDSQADLLMGGFVMFTRRAWDAAKGLDERYFLYCEEVDMFHRLAGMGHTFWRIAAARGYHEAGHGNETSPMRILYLAAGTAQFARVHWSWPASVLGRLLFWIAAMERYSVGRLLGHRSPWLRNRAKAYRLIALYPGLWWFGYDKRRGLLKQLEERGGPPA